MTHPCRALGLLCCCWLLRLSDCLVLFIFSCHLSKEIWCDLTALRFTLSVVNWWCFMMGVYFQPALGPPLLVYRWNPCRALDLFCCCWLLWLSGSLVLFHIEVKFIEGGGFLWFLVMLDRNDMDPLPDPLSVKLRYHIALWIYCVGSYECMVAWYFS